MSAVISHIDYTFNQTRHAAEYLKSKFGIELPDLSERIIFIQSNNLNGPVAYARSKTGILLFDVSQIASIRRRKWMVMSSLSEGFKRAIRMISPHRLESDSDYIAEHNRIMGNYPKNYFFASILKELVVFAIKERIIPPRSIKIFTDNEIKSIMADGNLDPNKKEIFKTFSENMNAEAIGYIIANTISSSNDPIFIPNYYPPIAADKIREISLKLRGKTDSNTKIRNLLTGSGMID